MGAHYPDAAGVVARALKPHDGLPFYRGLVYGSPAPSWRRLESKLRFEESAEDLAGGAGIDNHMDWDDLKNDRGRAAWDSTFQERDSSECHELPIGEKVTLWEAAGTARRRPVRLM